MKAIRDTHENIYDIELCNWKKKETQKLSKYSTLGGQSKQIIGS